MSRKNKQMKPIGQLLSGFDWDERKYIAHEFQDYGYRLAQQLGDLPHKALYIKLAKETPRHLLEEALRCVKESASVRKPAMLFMWKLKQLKEGKKDK
ncbi:hypothetical protein MUP65_01855 [Patescibacteria group bacterium]|nr:hypothetical protein [Patescibacteria group bacterium]